MGRRGRRQNVKKEEKEVKEKNVVEEEGARDKEEGEVASKWKSEATLEIITCS